MIRRRILVAIVAAMGLSIPSGLDFGAGFNAFRSWTIAQLADWDGWRPIEEPVPVTEVFGLAGFETTRIVTRSVVMDEEQPAPASPSELSERADEGSSDGRAAPTSYEPVKTEDVASTTASSHSDEMGQSMVFCKFAEANPVDEMLPSSSTIGQEAHEAAGGIFEEDPGGYEPSEEALASEAGQPPMTTAKPSFELIEPTDGTTDLIASELNRLSDGMAVAPEFRAVQPARRPRFEPIVLADDLDSGTADELNRASEGLAIVPPKAGRGGQPEFAPTARADRQPVLNPEGARGAHTPGRTGYRPDIDGGTLRRAFRMTGDAARAWMEVLSGPESDQVAFR